MIQDNTWNTDETPKSRGPVRMLHGMSAFRQAEQVFVWCEASA
jgi:hypothetical protein